MTFENDLLNQLELLIRSNKSLEARRLLAKIQPNKVLRKNQSKLASYARRLNLPNLALKILQSSVRGEDSTIQSPSDEEKAEYAISLMRMGSLPEALKMLEEIENKMMPKYLLFKSFCLFNQWNYEAAIPYLEAYVQLPAMDDYQRLIGKLNLASAFVYLAKFDEAKVVLEELLQKSQEHKFRLIETNATELKIQLLVASDHLLEAQKKLSLLKDSQPVQKGTLSHLYLQKWTAIINGLLTQRIDDLRQLKSDRSIFHSEVLREIDFYILRIEPSLNLALKLYAGTPFQGYQEKIAKLYPSLRNYSECLFSKELDSVSEASIICRLDQIEKSIPSPLRPVSAGLSLCLTSLFRDFYRPTSVGYLFSVLFNDEYYNPFSSPNKIHQLVHRLKILLKENNWSIQINHSSKGYLPLINDTEFAVQVTLQRDRVTTPDFQQLIDFKRFIKDDQFIAKDLAAFTLKSKSSVHLLIKIWIEKGWIEPFGSSSKTVYYFLSEDTFKQKASG